ncbi:MAG: squalene--hopene cyclase [Planctomycetia bacterium]|nr:squalene--hopene cyclase [Planctomycetia bacterium]
MKVLAAPFAWVLVCSAVHAAEPVTLANLVAPSANAADEPLAARFSVAKAASFLDSAALEWQRSRDCMTCHTNYAFLMARPAISVDAPAHAEVRKYAEQLVTERWPAKGPRWDTEVVATATVLAFNDAATTGRLHPVTRQALDKMWTLQREDGGWTWIKCDWPPMESDDYFGATFAAVGAGVAPEGYADTPAARAGLEKIRAYFKNNPPPTLHHKAMILWGASYVPLMMDEGDQKATLHALKALQHEDGGWGLATLGDWKRGDGSPQDTAASDGYGTGFVIYVLRRAGVPADDPQIQRGIAWLKSHQRESGRWFTRSVHADSKHYITHAGTAFAVMALRECGKEQLAAD